MRTDRWTLTFFLLDALAVMWSPLRSISWLSPFQYCRPIDAALQEGSQFFNIAVLLAVFLTTATLALWRFERQDL